MDAVFDLVGGDTLRAAATLLADPAALISAGGKPLAEELGGAAVDRARTAAVLDEVANLVVTGALRTHVSRTFPLDAAADALRVVEDGHTLGKIVIEVGA